MTRHARKPAIIALAAALAVSVAALAATGQFHRIGGPPTSLAQLEQVIGAGKADAATWNAYGDALREQKRFAHAADAYQRALELDPDRPMARYNAALCLAQAGAPDKFFAYFTQVTANDPRQAVDLLDRPELASLHNNPQWDQAASSARAQAAD